MAIFLPKLREGENVFLSSIEAWEFNPVSEPDPAAAMIVEAFHTAVLLEQL